MRRREFVALLGGAAAPPMLAVRPTRAEQRGRMRRLGVLMSLTADDRESQLRLAAFLQGLRERGWTEGTNLAVETRWAGDNLERAREHAGEFAALAPDAVLTSGSISAVAMRRATDTVPIVFVQVAEPHGLVESFARPGANVTGFASIENGISEKWLELLKEIAPRTRRAVIIRDPDTNAGAAQFMAIQAAAPALQLQLAAVGVRDRGEIERAIAAFAHDPNGGLVVTTSTRASAHRDLILALAVRHRLPAVYPFRFYVAAGGLIAYGADWIDQYRGAAGYIDRILRGETPATMPVQTPAKYELTINLRTARALGLDVPASVRARADEVIE